MKPDHGVLKDLKTFLIKDIKHRELIPFIGMSEEELKNIEVGDIVERMLGFMIPDPKLVTAVDEDTITCSFWDFDRKTGIEIDDEIPTKVSYIRRVISKGNIRGKDSNAKFD